MKAREAAEPPLNLHEFPRAIVHFDGDAFFTSVEQALHPPLRGRPVITGLERGIIACASYEAKALGIRRGVALHEARRMCPRLVTLPSDYESYSLFSRRMFDIARRFTPWVEEYSIDEGFADLTGARRLFRRPYPEIARALQTAIAAELGITVSVGLSLTKSLAKLCSKFRKPRGFTAVAGYHIHRLLQLTPLDKVWGFGPNTVALLTQRGLATAYDYAARPQAWADRLLGKIGRELWLELRGEAVHPVTIDAPSAQASISKCKTFPAPSADRDFVRAKLLRNAESAFIKLRRHRLRARALTVALRKRNYDETALEARLTRATAVTAEAVPLVGRLFDQLFEPGAEYRSTVIVLSRLEPDRERQGELFEDPVRIEKLERLAAAVDAVNARLGKHKLALGTALFLGRHPASERDGLPWRKHALLAGETARQRLGIPRLDISV